MFKATENIRETKYLVNDMKKEYTFGKNVQLAYKALTTRCIINETCILIFFCRILMIIKKDFEEVTLMEENKVVRLVFKCLRHKFMEP